MELLIGCGVSREKKIYIPGKQEWSNLVTLDNNPDRYPDVLYDLMLTPLPFEENSFDEIHAYEVLEHTGQQGDWRWFFRQWMDFWRILKPGGRFFATVPHWQSPWALGDPSHSRVLVIPHVLVFLNQEQYHKQCDVEKNDMSDFRFCYHADFEKVYHELSEDCLQSKFVLMAHKPARSF